MGIHNSHSNDISQCLCAIKRMADADVHITLVRSHVCSVRMHEWMNELHKCTYADECVNTIQPIWAIFFSFFLPRKAQQTTKFNEQRIHFDPVKPDLFINLGTPIRWSNFDSNKIILYLFTCTMHVYSSWHLFKNQ